MNLSQQVGDNIRNLRIKNEWSQFELADRAGVNRSYVSGIELGRHNTGVNNVAKVARALGVQPYELLKPKFAPVPGMHAQQSNRVVIDWPTFKHMLRICKDTPYAVKNFLERKGVELVG